MSEIRVVGAVFIDGDRVLAFRRKPGKAAAGKWEFPGGKIEAEEAPEQALARELDEELGLTHVEVGPCIDRTVTPVGENLIDLACYEVACQVTPTVSSDHDRIEWVNRAALLTRDWAEPDLPTVMKLMNGESESHG